MCDPLAPPDELPGEATLGESVAGGGRLLLDVAHVRSSLLQVDELLTRLHLGLVVRLRPGARIGDRTRDVAFLTRDRVRRLVRPVVRPDEQRENDHANEPQSTHRRCDSSAIYSW